MFASLILGGFDSSLFEPNDLTCAFNADDAIDLTLNIHSISISTSSGNKTLRSTSFPVFIDSTIPYLYLPINVCQQFEVAFGIKYDNVTELYLVNDTIHNHLLAQNANVTFTVTNLTAEVLADIVHPI